METALLNLFGLSLGLLAKDDRDLRGARLPASGREVIALAIDAGTPGLARLMTQLSGAFWNDLAHPGTSIERRRDLVRAATAVVEHAATSAGDAPLPSSAQAAGVVPCGQRLARIAGRYRHDDGIVSPNDRSPHEIDATLSALYAALDVAGRDLDAAIAAIGKSLAERSAPDIAACESVDEATLADLQRQLAHDTGLSPALVEAIVSADRRLGFSARDIAMRLAERIVAVIDLLTELVRMADRSGSDENLERRLLDAASRVRSGDFMHAACSLATHAREIEGSAVSSSPDIMGFALFPALLAARARLASLDGHPREAAQLYHKSADVWPRVDRVRRWQLKLAEARALRELGSLPAANPQALCEAAQVFATAGSLVSESDDPIAWAEANLELGSLLLDLGRRDSRPERYLAAALYFKPAIAVFARDKTMDGWARAQLGLAHALRGQGSFQGDVVTLSEAAFAYRATLGILTATATPELWHEARYFLGETLVRIAEEAGDVEALQQAIELLIPVSADKPPHCAPFARYIGEIAFARALVFLHVEDPGSAPADDTSILDEAAEMLTRALTAPRTDLTDLDRARAEAALGDVLWHLHDGPTGSADAYGAIDALRRAAQLYERLENPIEAGAATDRITAMETSIRGSATAAEQAVVAAADPTAPATNPVVTGNLTAHGGRNSRMSTAATA